MNLADLDAEFGISGYNQPLNNTTTIVWELPFGRDRRWGNAMTRVLEAIAGGWRMTAIKTMTSGQPVNLSYNPSGAQNVSGAPTYRPNVIGDIYAPDDQRTPNNFFNSNNVTIPTSVSQPFGDAPRNAASGPAIFTLDLGLHKSVALPYASSGVELRVEAFNVFNRTNFSPANGNRSSTAFGTITTLATPPRQIQLGVKVDF